MHGRNRKGGKKTSLFVLRTRRAVQKPRRHAGSSQLCRLLACRALIGAYLLSLLLVRVDCAVLCSHCGEQRKQKDIPKGSPTNTRNNIIVGNLTGWRRADV